MSCQTTNSLFMADYSIKNLNSLKSELLRWYELLGDVNRSYDYTTNAIYQNSVLVKAIDVSVVKCRKCPEMSVKRYRHIPSKVSIATIRVRTLIRIKKELIVIEHFPTESLKIIKPNGSEIENVIGLVSMGKKKITIEDVSLDIEEGDTIVRDLPNGKQEHFTVIDPGFARGMGGHIPDYYSVSIERISKLPKADTHGSGYITVVNEGGRVNINSTDNSINIQVSNDTERLFNELATALEETRDQALLDSVSKLKQSVGTTSYAEKYNQFIQNAANHMTLVAPFLPAISALLVN